MPKLVGKVGYLAAISVAAALPFFGGCKSDRLAKERLPSPPLAEKGTARSLRPGANELVEAAERLQESARIVLNLCGGETVSIEKAAARLALEGERGLTAEGARKRANVAVEKLQSAGNGYLAALNNFCVANGNPSYNKDMMPAGVGGFSPYHSYTTLNTDQQFGHAADSVGNFALSLLQIAIRTKAALKESDGDSLFGSAPGSSLALIYWFASRVDSSTIGVGFPRDDFAKLSGARLEK